MDSKDCVLMIATTTKICSEGHYTPGHPEVY